MKGVFWWDEYGPTPLGLFVGIMVFIFTVTALVLGFVVILGSHACNESIDRLELEGDYGFWTGCVVEVEGTNIPLENYFVNTEK